MFWFGAPVSFHIFPACQQLIRFAREKKFGKLIEVRSYFRHSSDMDPTKPINWKRQVEYNGEYGCMGDLGIHTQHVPFRLGWIPQNVSAKLSKIISQRPDGHGGTAACLTWDNAVLTCDAKGSYGETIPIDSGYQTPFTLDLPTNGESRYMAWIAPPNSVPMTPMLSITPNNGAKNRPGAGWTWGISLCSPPSREKFSSLVFPTLFYRCGRLFSASWTEGRWNSAALLLRKPFFPTGSIPPHSNLIRSKEPFLFKI